MMRSKAITRTVLALVGQSAATWCTVVSCEPQDIYLFDKQPARTQPDSGTNDPAAVGADAGPAPPEQPACESAACEACVSERACSEAGALLFCHPQTGTCARLCGAGATGQPIDDCPSPQRCDRSRNLCVDCVENRDCDEGPLLICFLPRGRCVECVMPNDCPTERPVCDPPTSRCVECNSTPDCRVAGEVCLVSQQSCVQCRDDEDCSGASEGTQCLPGEQRCVECVSNEDCSSIDPQRPYCSSGHECEDDDD